MGLINIELGGIAGQEFKLTGVQNRIAFLPDHIKAKMGPDMLQKLAEILQQRMRLRAPGWTRKLKEGIQIGWLNPGTIKVYVAGVAAGYAGAQETGYRKHWVGGWFATKSGYTFADWVISKGGPANAKFMTFYPKKYTPFAQPAFEGLLTKIDEICKAEVENGLRKAGFTA